MPRDGPQELPRVAWAARHFGQAPGGLQEAILAPSGIDGALVPFFQSLPESKRKRKRRAKSAEDLDKGKDLLPGGFR